MFISLCISFRRCDDCGKSGTHIKCSNLRDGPMSEFRCQDCESIGSSPIDSSVPVTGAIQGKSF